MPEVALAREEGRGGGRGNAARVAWEGTGKGLVGTQDSTHEAPATCAPPPPHYLPFLAPTCPLLLYQQDLEAFGEALVVMKPIQWHLMGLGGDRVLWGHGANAWGNDQDPLGDIWGAVGGKQEDEWVVFWRGGRWVGGALGAVSRWGEHDGQRGDIITDYITVIGSRVLGEVGRTVGEVSGRRLGGDTGEAGHRGQGPDRSAGLCPRCPQWPWPAGTWSSSG